jgi:cellulose synthase/poly-beta-1,6-N-acetylglucosamine synthase-like glycosyltransferase
VDVDLALKVWVCVVISVMMVYALRHWLISIRRLVGSQRPYYQDLLDSDLPSVSVVIPMHNEEAVADQILNALLDSAYPKHLLEIVPIDDHSDDHTAEILRRYEAEHSQVKPLFRNDRVRGKPAALNEALTAATNEIVLVFDADYRPGPDAVRALVMAFQDPEVGAVMGRVVPSNAGATLLTRLLDLERSGGYQVDQQARYTLDLVPQFGGTAGGFRRSVALSLGGFGPRVSADDTDLTVRLYLNGWKVAYANGVECYEEVPETWDARFHQLRRWSRGHNQVLLRHGASLLRSRYLRPIQRLDGMLMLVVYLVPPLLLSALAAELVLFLQGDLLLLPTVILAFFLVTYSEFGNFAPFLQVGIAGVLDGMAERVLFLPFFFFAYLFNQLAVTCGLADAVLDIVWRRDPIWRKTPRFRR